MSTISWLPYSLGATLLFGVSMAFYKSPSAKGHSRFATMAWSSVISLVLSVIFFYSFLGNTSISMVGSAAVWGVSFTLLSLLQMYALTHVDTGALFPITTTSALVLTILIGLAFFKDSVSLLQIVGMGVAVIAVFFFLRKGGFTDKSKLLLWVGSGIIFLSTFNKVWQKLAAVAFDIHAFQIYQYLFAVVASLVMVLLMHKKEFASELLKRPNIQTGGLIGLFGFVGGYLILIALSRGPISLINTIHSFYVLPTALTAALLFKEKLTTKIWILMGATLLAIVLIKLG